MARKKTGAVRYAGIPLQVLRHRNYVRLSYSARALLMELRMQYNGFNNGSLRATFAMLEPRGWKSKETVNYGLKELLHCGFIERTRKGKRFGGTHFPSLYALTWEPQHANDVDGIPARLVPSDAWKADHERFLRPVRKKKPKGGIRTCKGRNPSLSKDEIRPEQNEGATQ